MTVDDLFLRVLQRLPTLPPTIAFVDAAQGVQDVITRRLWEGRSDLLKLSWQSDAQAVGTSEVELPDEFLGIGDENPFLTYTSGSSTQVATVQPLCGPRSRYITAADGIPAEFEIRGNLMELFPGSSVAFTLHVPMYARPDPLRYMTDHLPWNGLYDQLFQDAVLHMGGPNGMVSMVHPQLEQAIMRAVDTGTAIRTGRKVRWYYA